MRRLRSQSGFFQIEKTVLAVSPRLRREALTGHWLCDDHFMQTWLAVQSCKGGERTLSVCDER